MAGRDACGRREMQVRRASGAIPPETDGVRARARLGASADRLTPGLIAPLRKTAAAY